jgi:hypothetical protein
MNLFFSNAKLIRKLTNIGYPYLDHTAKKNIGYPKSE